jgi:CheY-like chemotaxis protein
MQKINLKILLVEDEPIAQIIGKNIIEKAGYTLDIVNSTNQALRMLKNNTYDLIFMDLGLPEISGLDFTKEIIKKFKLKTPIIAITAFNKHSKKEECIKSGFTDFIEKPFSEKQLKNITEKIFFKKHNTIKKAKIKNNNIRENLIANVS